MGGDDKCHGQPATVSHTASRMDIQETEQSIGDDERRGEERREEHRRRDSDEPANEAEARTRIH